MNYQLLQGDNRQVLRTLPDQSVHCIVTSPPYFGLRDYGVDGQIGLEETPAAYVTELVTVFRECWRVLRDDGTLWCNLGDSYAGSGKGGQSDDKRSENWQPVYGNKGKTYGLKPKDLIGIPWRVAKALQSPFYTGKIKNEMDRVWLAAMIDGEGCFYIHRRQAGQHAGDGYYRKNDTYSCAIEVANTHLSIIERCHEITGLGSIIRQDKDRRQPLYRWTVRCDEAREVAREIYPYLVAKKQQCRIISGIPAGGERAVAGWEAMKALHSGTLTDVDFPEPESMFVPGYYLRSDIIWSKPNPMPESVTDRPTKAHEYIFLLTKSQRYYYDADAIREKMVTPIHMPGNKLHPDKIKGPNDRNGHSQWEDTETRAWGNPAGRNRRSVWTVPTSPYPGAHFATFPPALIEPCILAGTSEHGCCNQCGAPWERVTKKGFTAHDGETQSAYDKGSTANRLALLRQAARARGEEYSSAKETIGWQPTCTCNADIVPATVLDPFNGSGTTGAVACAHNRNYIGIDLSAAYIELAHARIREAINASGRAPVVRVGKVQDFADMPLFAD